MEKSLSRYVLVLLFAPILAGAQTSIWDESVDGDLGNGLGNRTNLGVLNTGAWTIMGDLDALPNFTGLDDIDTIEFTTSDAWTYVLLD